MLAFLLALALQEPPAVPQGPRDAVESEVAPSVVLREIAFEGASAYSRATLLEAIRLKTGEPLKPRPESVARVLETYYRLEGYRAARVSASFEAGVLTLRVDEGRLEGFAVEGLPADATEPAREALGLETGRVLRESDLWEALARLHQASEGAIRPVGDEPYTVETTETGARVTFHLRATTARIHFRGAGARSSGRINRVDGIAPGVFLELALTNRRNYNHWRLFGVAAYGFSSKDLRYGVGVLRGLGPTHPWSYGYNYHDWTDTDDAFRRYGLEEAPKGLVNTEQGIEFYRRFGHEVFGYRKLGAKAQAGLLFRSDDYRSLPVTTKDPPIASDSAYYNPPIPEGRMNSFVATVRWVSLGALYQSQESEGRALFQPSFYGTDWFRKPEAFRLDATLEVSRPGLGSDFNFTRFIGRLRWHREVGFKNAVDGRVLGGLTGGDPPLEKLFALGGLNTLRGYERKRIQGERMALVNLEWAFYPSPRWPALIGFWDGGGAWGGEPTADGQRTPAGWHDDLGAAVRWPPRTNKFFGRLDVAWPLSPLPGQKSGPRVNFRIQLPI